MSPPRSKYLNCEGSAVPIARKRFKGRMVTLVGDLIGEFCTDEDCATRKPVFQSDWRQGFN